MEAYLGPCETSMVEGFAKLKKAKAVNYFWKKALLYTFDMVLNKLLL